MTHTHCIHRRNGLRNVAAMSLATMLLLMVEATFAQAPAPTTAPTDTVRIRVRPHCEKANPTECAQYTVKDPVTVETPILVPGSILDMDIIIENPKNLPIRRARAWVSYDPNVLEGKKIEIGKRFPVVTPGEADFNIPQGFVQIGVSAEGTTEIKDPLIPLARLQFTAKTAPQGGKTPLAYYDVQPGLAGHTLVTRTDPSGQGEQNVLHPAVGSLIVRIEGPAPTPTPTSAASSVASITASSSSAPPLAVIPGTSSAAVSSAAPIPPVSSTAAQSSIAAAAVSSGAGQSSSQQSSVLTDNGRSSFVLLQVQGVRLTTEGSTVYLAWDHLPSSQLKGYNVYYGAETGRYLQRRSLPKDANTLAIRALPLDTTYYFAVRAVNLNDEESAFSQEVAVKVGSPATSTSPLAQILQDDGPGGKNPVDVKNPPSGTPGETGLPSMILLLVLSSAIIGTLFAFRRQMSAATLLK